MSSRRPSRRVRLVLLVPMLCLLPAFSARAQLISPKTVPVFQGEQFGIYPSQWPGMGGASIALQDTLGDPWSNPAKATRLRTGMLNVMPFSHRATAGGGRSLPVSMMQTGGRLAGGVLFTLQEVERTDAAWNATISERRASNAYYDGVLAWRVGTGLSIGGGLSYADLHGVDGVSALYAGNNRVLQRGQQVDMRLGLTRDFASGATLEVVGVSNRYRMEHEVGYPTFWRWAPPCTPAGPVQPGCEQQQVPARTEVNQDRTNTVGIHTVYLAPATESGWRVGYLFTANRLSHPKIPNYEFQNIPRDPGHTNAFNAGVGFHRQDGNTTFGMDVILEPMWSTTWADAAGDTTNVNGVVIPQGDHTVDNRFRFTNARIKVGIAHEIPGQTPDASRLMLQAGLGLRSISYTLDQSNHVLVQSRTQDESWIEWTPMLAVQLRGRMIDVGYSWSYTCGPDCPALGTDTFLNAPERDGGGVIGAPSGPLSFNGGSSGRHRVMVTLRLQ